MGKCFDITAALETVSSDRAIPDGNYHNVDLTAYSSYTHEALHFLVENNPVVDDISFGFHHLDTKAVQLIVNIQAEFVSFENLHSLESSTARILWWKNAQSHPILSFKICSEINRAAAHALVSPPTSSPEYLRPLSISLPSIQASIAKVLSQHQHELYIEIYEQQITHKAAKYLVRHTGSQMNITLPYPADDLLRNFFYNAPRKDVEFSGKHIKIADLR